MVNILDGYGVLIKLTCFNINLCKGNPKGAKRVLTSMPSSRVRFNLKSEPEKGQYAPTRISEYDSVRPKIYETGIRNNKMYV